MDVIVKLADDPSSIYKVINICESFNLRVFQMETIKSNFDEINV